ncbi:YbgA family protein [Streptococcus agalactiae]|nr:YbgA family protein [Streptococcus agalactiae]
MTKEAELLWAKHKYLVLSKSQKIYLDIRQTLKSPNCTVLDVQSLIDQAVLLEESPSQVTNAYMHIWGYFKNKAERQEKEEFLTLLEKYRKTGYQRRKLLAFLKQLLAKYPNSYLLNSSIFEEE